MSDAPPRHRLRSNWCGKLVLQIEEQVPVNYDESDPREVVPCRYVGRWRDARVEDVLLNFFPTEEA